MIVLLQNKDHFLFILSLEAVPPRPKSRSKCTLRYYRKVFLSVFIFIYI